MTATLTDTIVEWNLKGYQIKKIGLPLQQLIIFLQI